MILFARQTARSPNTIDDTAFASHLVGHTIGPRSLLPTDPKATLTPV